jgi:hypothetical protein
MRIAKLIELVERAGGRFVLEDRQASLAWSERLTIKQRARARRLDRQVRRCAYQVTAELLERAYARWWESHIACKCPARRFAHPPHKTDGTGPSGSEQDGSQTCLTCEGKIQ